MRNKTEIIVIPAKAGIQRPASAGHKNLLQARFARTYQLDPGSALALGELVRDDK